MITYFYRFTHAYQDFFLMIQYIRKSTMKKIVLTALMAAAATTAASATYQIDPLHTNARFAIDHFA